MRRRAGEEEQADSDARRRAARQAADKRLREARDDAFGKRSLFGSDEPLAVRGPGGELAPVAPALLDVTALRGMPGGDAASSWAHLRAKRGETFRLGGLRNGGNTCFANAALQVMLRQARQPPGQRRPATCATEAVGLARRRRRRRWLTAAPWQHLPARKPRRPRARPLARAARRPRLPRKRQAKLQPAASPCAQTARDHGGECTPASTRSAARNAPRRRGKPERSRRRTATSGRPAP